MTIGLTSRISSARTMKVYGRKGNSTIHIVVLSEQRGGPQCIRCRRVKRCSFSLAVVRVRDNACSNGFKAETD